MVESQRPDVQEESEEDKGRRMAIIETLASIIKDKRNDAIEGRRSSGIEEIWSEDDDHYEGRDKYSQGSTLRKGRSTTDSPREITKKSPTRSTVFLKITRPYTDAASARVADMLLPTDDRNWALRPTPRPELVKQLQDQTPVQPQGAMMQPQIPQQAQPMQQPPQPPQPAGGIRGAISGMFGGMFGGGQQQAPEPTQAEQPAGPTVADMAQQAIDKAKASSERAQEEIDDYLVECRYHAEVRKVIESSARLGTGILKGPHPTRKKSRAATQTEEGWTVEIKEETKPCSVEVNPWNFYPDPACGEDIQRGSYVFEVDDMTARQLRELKGGKYIDEMIDLCIEDGPISAIDGTRTKKEGEKTRDKDLFQIWYFHGQVSRKEMESAGCKCGDKESYPAIVTMVNDRIIKISLSPLDSGEFPYDVMVWQKRIGHWAGEGVPRQMRECQKGANAAARNLMDNAGLSAGPQIIVNRNKIVPANNKWELTPRKIWFAVKDEEVQSVNDAFVVINIPTMQEQLMAILQFWLKEAEDVTGLPMLVQGQQGSAPETVGGMTMLNNNATSVLRRIARTFDDRITEPHIGRYYEWLLLHGPDDAKGDFTIDARGSSALIERDTQSQQLMQMVGLSANPAYGLDPVQVIREVLKSMRFDPKRLEFSDEQKQAMANQPPPEDPRIAAANIKAEVETAKQQAQHQFEAEQNERDRLLERSLAKLDAEMKAAELAGAETMAMGDVKAMLAKVAMQLKTQKDLFVGESMLDAHKTYNPPQVAQSGTEVPGRAPAGKGFTQ